MNEQRTEMEPILESVDGGTFNALLDPHAIEVVGRLRSAGHEAYLVGGCVRDLLLGRTPKDFDVATDAHPSEVRMLIRNCRLIGKRFRLAHVYFRGGKIIETATFRASPFEETDSLPEDLYLKQDNVFGTAAQDARRRDFTINGLFLDVDSWQVIDYVNGLSDLRQRAIRTIGDPEIRIQEDPVRILRAIKFASRLNFQIEAGTWEAVIRHAPELGKCAPSRVLEELYRIVHSGSSAAAMELLRGCGAIAVMMPEFDAQEVTTEEGESTRVQLGRLLRAYDRAREMGYQGANELALALLWAPYFMEHNGSRNRWLADHLSGMGQRLRCPKRDRERARLMLHLLPDLSDPPTSDKRVRQIINRSAFSQALTLYALWLYSRAEPIYPVGEWKSRAQECGVDVQAPSPAEDRQRPARRSRRGGRRGRARSE